MISITQEIQPIFGCIRFTSKIVSETRNVNYEVFSPPITNINKAFILETIKTLDLYIKNYSEENKNNKELSKLLDDMRNVLSKLMSKPIKTSLWRNFSLKYLLILEYTDKTIGNYTEKLKKMASEDVLSFETSSYLEESVLLIKDILRLIHFLINSGLKGKMMHDIDQQLIDLIKYLLIFFEDYNKVCKYAEKNRFLSDEMIEKLTESYSILKTNIMQLFVITGIEKPKLQFEHKLPETMGDVFVESFVR